MRRSGRRNSEPIGCRSRGPGRSTGPCRRRWPRRLCCRSQCRIVHSYLSCISLAQQRLESEIQRGRVQLFTSHGNLCWCWHDRVLSSFSKGRAIVGCAGYFSRRRGHHGHRWHLVFPRSTIVAENRRRCVRDHWFVFAAQIEIHSVFISSAPANRRKPSRLCRRQCRVQP